MTPREKLWLFVGTLIGLAATLIVFAVMSRSPAAGLMPGVQTSLDAPETEGDLPPGSPVVVQLTAGDQDKIGVQTSTVRFEVVSAEIVTSARVEELGTAIRTISATMSGRIERLFVNSIGQLVTKGQPLATISSPDLVTAAEEYRSAVRDRRLLDAGQPAEAVTRADALVNARRRRLEMWRLTPAEIQDMVSSPEKPIYITLYSDSAGIVRTENISEGRYVGAGEALLVLTDLNTIWIKADIFEPDIGRIRPGLSAKITSEAVPGITLGGIVNFIDSRSDLQTGTTPVRIQVENPGMRLRPGMFVRCVLQASSGSRILTVPRSAVIDTGTDKIVYFVMAPGVFQRRSIQVGPPGKELYPVLGGLREGDQIVTNGAFLIDSQARLTGGVAGLSGDSRSLRDSAAPFEPTATASAYSITFRVSPEQPSVGNDSKAHVVVLDSSRKPVSDAQVRVTTVMPAMPSMGMPEMRQSTDLQWRGSEYLGAIRFGIAGAWSVVVEVRRGGEVLTAYQTRLDAR